MLDALKNATPGSVILLHVCAHNPTGVDPTQDQWKKISEVMKANSLIPFFDSAYQGFASGNLEKDIWPVRYFLEQGFNMFICQSFAKNMGMYGERVGALHIVVSNKDIAEKLLSQVKYIQSYQESSSDRCIQIPADMELNLLLKCSTAKRTSMSGKPNSEMSSPRESLI